MAILYFIHTFIYSQLNASPVLFSDFKMVEDGKYEFISWGKMSLSRLMASLRQEFSMDKRLYRLGDIPQVLNVWMFELCSNVDTKVVVKKGNSIPRILNWRVVAVRPQFNQFMTGMFINSGKDVPIGIRSDSKEQRQIRNAKEKQTTDTKEKSKVDADSTCINRKELLVKADLDSLESEIKTYVKTYIDQKFKDLEHVMNDRFSEVLKSLQQKNETVEKEKVAKQSPKEGQHSDDVADFEGHRPTSTDSLVKENDKPVEMEGDKANQAPSHFKNGE
ncbi:hypothetical protein FXO38_22811 [Capsicum annuum]|nr:hypothetical protein FXO38_22811 [Capsicum annuum]KAF3684108.1 hypothetical protein FXO37_01507 [Capsicum annuum]